MNALPPGDFRAALSRETQDEKMEQIREILFGDSLRTTDARIALLEARIRELEVALHRRLDALQARIDAMASQSEAARGAAFDDLARGVHELGERVRRIAQT